MLSIRFEVGGYPRTAPSGEIHCMRSPGEFLSGEVLKVKYTLRLSNRIPAGALGVSGPIESTASRYSVGLVIFQKNIISGIHVVGGSETEVARSLAGGWHFIRTLLQRTVSIQFDFR